MREIKFRAWYGKDNKMIDWFTLSQSAWNTFRGETPLSLIYEILVARKDDFKVMQYIGFKDKYDVEIYEGDIVKDSEQTYIVRFGELATAVCVFIGFYLEHLVYIEFSGPLSSFDSDVLEVIGNVHQNPELLK